MIHAVIPAAGQGKRMREGNASWKGTKKQLLELCGLPIIIHTLRIFQNTSSIDQIVCVIPREDLSAFENLISGRALTKVIGVVPGGERRQDSVRAGLAFLETKSNPDDIVLVHDGVRPLVTAAIIERVISAAEKFGGAVAAVPVRDSLKRISDDRVIEKTISRENVWAMQTPQAFRLGRLLQAYREAEGSGFLATDEAMLMERSGFPVHCIDGAIENIKITDPADLKIAELFLRERMTADRRGPDMDAPFGLPQGI